MHLSHNARKGLAAGLAASTVLMSAMVGILPAAFAAPHAEGCLVLSNGTVYMVTGGQLRGFPSAEVFTSWGNGFGGVQAATAEDLALPMGPVLVYADGTLVKGPNDPLVYLVANGQKRGFTTGDVFTGLGFKFSNIQSAPANTFADLPTGANLDSATERHTAGVWVIDSTGTVWRMTATGRVGLPSMEVFNSWGKSFSTVVAANAADLAAPVEGVASAKPSCSGSTTPGQTGSVTLASDNPASATLVAGQAVADLAHFQFSGSTINSVTFERIGVSANTTPSNVYLFNGSTRLTDAASFGSDNKVTFAGLNIGTPVTVAVKSDIASGTSGQTVGVRAVSYNGNPVSVSGNIHNIASASLATVALSAATGSGDTDPGNDIDVWEGTATVGTRDVVLNRVALRQIGSIQSSDIRNFRLLVDGTQVASSFNLDSNNYVTFTPNTTLKSGARNVKVLADIVGGSGRTVQMSLRGAYDFATTDTSYNVGVLDTGSFAFGPSAFNVNNGSLTVAKASDSPSQNLTLGASDVSLGKFTMTAYGESVKVETLTAQAVMSTNSTSATSIRNGRILINGTQYGSTTNINTGSGTSFTVNYTVVPGSPATVEIRGDVVDGDSTALAASDTIAVRLNTGSSNGTRQVSLSTLNVPAANVSANTLTVASGSISIAKTSNYANQTITVPQTAYKLGSFTITGNSTEAVNVNTFTLSVTTTDTDSSTGLSVADVTDVYLKYNGTQTSVKPSVAASGNTWSSSFQIPVNGSVTVDVYGTLSSDFTATDTVAVSLLVSGTTASSGTSVSTNSGSVLAGQTMTVGSGTITATLDASSPSAQLVDDSGTVTSAAYKFAALTDSYTVTDVTLTLADATAVSQVALMDGSTTLATKPAATTLTFSGLNVAVPANTNKVLSVVLTMSPVGVGAGTSDASLLTTLTAFTARSSNGVSDASANDAGPSIENNPAGNAMYVYKAVPTVSAVALPDADLHAGSNIVIAKFTVNSNGTGTVAWKQAMFEIAKTATPTIASPTLWNADTGEQITAATAFQNGSAGVATTCVGDNTSCEMLITVGTNADDDTVQSVSGAKTYEVRATIGGSIASTDNVSVKMDRNTTSHAASAAFATNKNAGTANSTSFTWSDESNAATGDTGVATWQKDYLIKNTPLSWNLN